MPYCARTLERTTHARTPVHAGMPQWKLACAATRIHASPRAGAHACAHARAQLKTHTHTHTQAPITQRATTFSKMSEAKHLPQAGHSLKPFADPATTAFLSPPPAPPAPPAPPPTIPSPPRPPPWPPPSSSRFRLVPLTGRGRRLPRLRTTASLSAIPGTPPAPPLSSASSTPTHGGLTPLAALSSALRVPTPRRP